jgi:gliding motility-associated-like protein
MLFMKKIMKGCCRYLVIPCLFLVQMQTKAQVYHTVTHLTGSQVIGYYGNEVTVTSVNGRSSTTAPACGAGPYVFGGKTWGIGGYTFTFSRIPAAVRARVVVIGNGNQQLDIVSFEVNGSPYPLSANEVSAITPPCTPLAYLVGGNLQPPLQGGNSGADVLLTMGPRSVTVICNDDWNGVEMQLLFSDVVVLRNDTVCEGDTLKLHCEPEVPGATYLWRGPGGFTSTQYNPIIPNMVPAQAGDYIVRMITTLGDTLVDTTRVTVIPNPNPHIRLRELPCAGSPLHLEAETLPLAGLGYRWTGPNGFIDSVATPFIDSVQVDHTGNYQLETTIWQCTYRTDTTITVLKPSFYRFTKVICEDDVFELNGKKYGQPGTYHDTIAAANGCDSNITLDLIVLPAPPVTISEGPQVCPWDTMMVMGQGAVRYEWYDEGKIIGNGRNQRVQVPRDGKKVSVVGWGENECTDTVHQTVHPIPFHLELTAPLPVRIYDVIYLKTSADRPYSVVAWYPEELFPEQSAYEQQLPADTTRGYTVVGLSAEGCLDTASFEVPVWPDSSLTISIPSAFTPNGDGRNDFFRPVIGGGITIRTFQVFDRWGRRVWAAAKNNAARGWDGSYDGRPVEMGTYYYNIELESYTGEVFVRNGSVTLLR